MKLNVLIVDDEPLAREGVVSFVKRVDFLELKEQCSDAMEANDYLAENNIDLMFLDIQMPTLSGTDFLRSVNQPPLVILTTAYPQYALEGFELDVVDYLVKPYAFERFLKAVNKAYERFNAAQSKTGSETKNSEAQKVFFIKSDRRYVRVMMDEVLYIQGNQNYIDIHTENKKIMTLMTLKHLEELLPSDQFMRVHKSYILPLRRIKEIEGNQVLIGDKYLPVSKKNKKKLLKRLFKN